MLRPDDPRYKHMHRMVRRLRGPASECQCVRCPRQAQVWAQVHTEDGTDPWADYVPLCRSCHCIYDRVNVGYVQSPQHRARNKAAKQGWRPSPEHLEKLHASRRGVPMSQEHKDKIAAARRGKRWNTESRQKMRIKVMERTRDSEGRFQ